MHRQSIPRDDQEKYVHHLIEHYQYLTLRLTEEGKAIETKIDDALQYVEEEKELEEHQVLWPKQTETSSCLKRN